MIKPRGWLVAVPLLVLASGTGCVGKKIFRDSMDDTDRRVAAVEDAVESTERGLNDLKQETDRRLAGVESDTQQAQNLGQQALGTAKSAEQLARGKLVWDVTITDDGVKFDFGKAMLSAPAISKLDNLISKVKGYGKAVYIEIEGHTDNVGGDKLNMTLGEKRAVAVRNYLNESGIPLHAINTISYGKSRPIADNSTSAGRAQNRRVVVRVLE